MVWACGHDGSSQRIASGVFGNEFSGNLACYKDKDPVAQLCQFVQIAGSYQYPAALCRTAPQGPVNIPAGHDINALSWFIEQEQPWVFAQPARQDHLLLVTAGQPADRLLGTVSADRVLQNQVLGLFPFQTPVHDEPAPVSPDDSGRNILPDREIQKSRIPVPVLGYKGDP